MKKLDVIPGTRMLDQGDEPAIRSTSRPPSPRAWRERQRRLALDYRQLVADILGEREYRRK